MMDARSRRIFISMLYLSILFVSMVSPAVAEIAASQPCGEQAPCEAPVLSDAQKAIAVMELSYEEFKALIESSEPFVLLDARAETMFVDGHIPGAVSFPLDKITEERAHELLDPADMVVVYCQSRECSVSHNAAVQLISYGYKVKDYKGGVQEWSEHGHQLEK